MTTLRHPVAQRRIEQYSSLRILVAFLGEKEQFAWWDSSFLSTTGRRFLTVICPKATMSASVNAATEAARRVHDGRIGKGRVYHLFRLPHPVETKVHRWFLNCDSETVATWVTTREAALGQLEKLATMGRTASAGPFQIGTRTSISAAATPGILAGAYLDAFRSGGQTMPYFADTAA